MSSNIPYSEILSAYEDAQATASNETNVWPLFLKLLEAKQTKAQPQTGKTFAVRFTGNSGLWTTGKVYEPSHLMVPPDGADEHTKPVAMFPYEFEVAAEAEKEVTPEDTRDWVTIPDFAAEDAPPQNLTRPEAFPRQHILVQGTKASEPYGVWKGHFYQAWPEHNGTHDVVKVLLGVLASVDADCLEICKTQKVVYTGGSDTFFTYGKVYDGFKHADGRWTILKDNEGDVFTDPSQAFEPVPETPKAPQARTILRQMVVDTLKFAKQSGAAIVAPGCDGVSRLIARLESGEAL